MRKTASCFDPSQEIRLIGLQGLILFAVLSSFWTDRSLGATRFEYHQLQMGTQFRIILYAANEAQAAKAASAVRDRLEDLEQILSDYRTDSELRRVCSTGAVGGAEIVSPELFGVLQLGQDVAWRTGGAFDMTIGPLVELWRQARRTGRLPEKNALEAAKKQTGYQKLLLNPRLRSIRFMTSGMKLDLGAIGKGYAADQALLMLREMGIESALIDAGGDIRVGAPPPGQSGWKVQSEPVPGTFVLAEKAIATSSDLYQWVEIEGVRYSHIVDSLTGLGLQESRVVTVVAPEAAQADALATALSVLPLEKGIQVARGLEGVEVRMTHFPDGQPVTVETPGFRSLSSEGGEKTR